MERLPVAGPSITKREIEAVAEAAARGWYGGASEFQRRFETAFADYIGTRFAICLPSCTAAIHLSLLALGIGPGDEVIVPDITWIATAAPISYVGAAPVFADIDARRWCLAPEAFEACVTPRSKAVIPVDLYGNMPAMDAIQEVARRHRIPIIEDAAEAIGSEYRGRRAGSLGAIGVFSFHGSKTVTTGEGGMLVTDREDVYRRVELLRDHGRRPGDKMFLNVEIGHKYKMSSMQAALGLAQLERIDELIARKAEIFAWYAQGLMDLDGVALNHEAPGTRSTYWMTTIIWDPAYGFRKEYLMDLLERRGIDTRPFFHPLSSLPAYSGLAEAAAARERNHVSYQISPYGVNLPSGLNMTAEKVAYVVQVVREIFRGVGAAGSRPPASRVDHAA
jgi:perosamine synthetase